MKWIKRILLKKVIESKITEIERSIEKVDYRLGVSINSKTIFRNSEKEYAIKILKELT